MIQSMVDLAAKNHTAFYTFDISVLKKRISYLKSFLPKNISLCYAVKANPFVIKEVAEDFERFEICSPGEAGICKTLGIPDHHMVISGVYKTPDFIEKLVSDPCFDGIFTVESMGQYQLFCDLSRQYHRSIQLILRLTNDSQFGVNKADIEYMIQDQKEQPFLHCIGIQFFSGTQKTSIKKLKREIAMLDQFLIHLEEDYHFTSKCLEYGPGFPIAYFEGEDFDEENYLKGFFDLLRDMRFKTKVILELGRSVVANCGKYYTHIVDIKINKGQNYALVDGGMHHLVYFGQHMAMKHPQLKVLGKNDIMPDQFWTICGSLCSMNDIIVKQINLPEIEIGDLICFENTGAYCMTEGIALFLSRDIPPIYLILENQEIICVRPIFETAQLNTPNYERTK